MDDLDLEILSSLRWGDPFASAESIGRQLRVSGNTVMARLRAMEERGVLRGFAVFPASILVNKGCWRWWFVRLNDRDAIDADAALRIEEVAACFWLYPDFAMVGTYHAEPGPPVPGRLVRALNGELVASFNHLWLTAERLPVAPGSPIDLRVVRALVRDPRGPASRLAKKANMATRTFLRHRRTLLSGGQVFIMPIEDMSRELGKVTYRAWGTTVDGLGPNGLGVDGARAILSDLTQPPSVYVYGHAGSYAALKEIEFKLRRNIALKNLIFWVPQGGVFAARRIEAWLDESLTRWRHAAFARRASRQRPLLTGP